MDQELQFKTSFNTAQSDKKKTMEENLISKRRNPFYINSMKYAGKKSRPQVMNDTSLKLEDKNVFKDARVRLILINNRRKTEREKKMKLA